MMDPQSDDYKFGVLDTQIGNLTSAIGSLTREVKILASEVSEIKLFRAKVVGMSIMASLIVSTLGVAIAEGIKAWAK